MISSGCDENSHPTPMRTSTPRPSLNALRAFEATVRLGSMSAAAGELFVTHGAVSRHIRALEDQLGLALLERGGGPTQPTAEGSRLAEGLGSAFRLIQASVEQLRPGPLTLSCSASIMMYWLLPRIGGFHQKHPDVELQFNMNYDRIDFVRDNIGLAIRNSSITPPKDARLRDLMVEWVGPVCSPEYLAACRIDRPEALAEARLLATKTRLEGWQDWVEASDYQGPALEVAARYEHFYLQIQAAVCGLGVALVPRMLVLDDLHSGKLVAPLGFVPSRRKLVLWVAPHLDGRGDVEALARWLAAEMRASETALAQQRASSPQRPAAASKVSAASGPARSRRKPA
jgi:LysR family glycine cleavage system transcriptional activator